MSEFIEARPASPTRCRPNQFQLTRNSDLYIDEEELRELKSLRKALQGELSQAPVRRQRALEVADPCSPLMIEALLLQSD